MIYGNDILLRKLTSFAEDADGDIVQGDAVWDAPIQCDAEPTGKPSVVTMPDGTRKSYSYIITLDVSERPFELGEHIKLLTATHAPDALRVKDSNAVHDANDAKVYVQAAREYEVLAYHRYRTIAKLWV